MLHPWPCINTSNARFLSLCAAIICISLFPPVFVLLVSQLFVCYPESLCVCICIYIYPPISIPLLLSNAADVRVHLSRNEQPAAFSLRSLRRHHQYRPLVVAYRQGNDGTLSRVARVVVDTLWLIDIFSDAVDHAALRWRERLRRAGIRIRRATSPSPVTSCTVFQTRHSPLGSFLTAGRASSNNSPRCRGMMRPESSRLQRRAFCFCWGCWSTMLARGPATSSSSRCQLCQLCSVVIATSMAWWFSTSPTSTMASPMASLASLCAT